LAKPDFKIYPNPAENFIRIETGSEGSKTLHLLNLDGTVIFKSYFSEQQTIMDLSGLSSGMYLISITSGNHRYFKKMVKK